jgi:ABC-type molybdate transport system permease subunit
MNLLLLEDKTHMKTIALSTTNKMQRYTIFFIIVNGLHVSGGFSAHHQELKNCTHSIWYVPGLLAATANGTLLVVLKRIH